MNGNIGEAVMYRTLTLSVLAAVAGVLASSNLTADDQSSGLALGAAETNPLLVPSTLAFQAPPFDKIKDSDFRPALEEGMRRHLAEVNAIADNTAPPTFENTLAALERSGQTLARVQMVFNALSSANTNDVLQKLQEEIAPKLAAHEDAILLNPKLFERIDALFRERLKLGLDPESARLLEHTYQQFTMAGAKLSETDKTALKKLNEEEAALSAKFTNQLLAAAKDGALVVSDKSELAGLAQADLDAAAQAAKSRNLEGKWVLTLKNTTQQPALQALTNRATREKLFSASWTRAEHGDANDTRDTIIKLAAIRADKA